jgi:hypothetical protein
VELEDGDVLDVLEDDALVVPELDDDSEATKSSYV